MVCWRTEDPGILSHLFHLFSYKDNQDRWSNLSCLPVLLRPSAVEEQTEGVGAQGGVVWDFRNARDVQMWRGYVKWNRWGWTFPRIASVSLTFDAIRHGTYWQQCNSTPLKKDCTHVLEPLQAIPVFISVRSLITTVGFLFLSSVLCLPPSV